MEARIELHTFLEELLGSRNVYFQPPESVKMKYPAIVYKLHNIEERSANNRSYTELPSYELTLIDPNPDSEYVKKLSRLRYCSFSRHYTADNLNHFVFIIYNIKGGLSYETCMG